MYGRGYDNTRYTPLKQINTGNVGKMKLAYSFQLGSLRSNEATPIVIGDTMVREHLVGAEVRAMRSTRAPARASGPTSPTFPMTCCSTPAATSTAAA